jgi:putative membrane protein
VLLLAGACGYGGGKGKETGPALPSVTASTPKERKPVLSSARSASVGSVVIDARGNTLYRYDKDSARPPRSNCIGSCVRKWQPVLAGDVLSTRGISQDLVGKVKRPDGRWQLTLAGWPLYRYIKDLRRGDLNGQNQDGVWFAIAPDGTKAAQGNAAGGAGGAGGSGAAGGGTPTRWGPLSDADRDLLVKIQETWLWELPAAEQARQRAKSRQVKDAAKQFAAQRADLEEEVRSVAGGLRVPLPRTPGAEQRTWMNELSAAAEKKTAGKEYDRLFVNRIRAAQGETLTLAARVRASTRNSLIREFAQRAVDTVMRQMALLEHTGLVDDAALGGPSTP